MLGYAYMEYLKQVDFVSNNTITVISNKLNND